MLMQKRYRRTISRTHVYFRNFKSTTFDEDLTKGYLIAGTGEMNEDGTVGRIGGIEKKVVAAHEDGMEVFFAPDDEITEQC